MAGLLLEVVALAVYPGGLFLGALAWITWRGAGLPRGGPPNANVIAELRGRYDTDQLSALRN